VRPSLDLDEHDLAQVEREVAVLGGELVPPVPAVQRAAQAVELLLVEADGGG